MNPAATRGAARCGRGCGGRGAYRTLPYAAAMVRLYTHGGLKPSTPIQGGSA
jgi:hypothetical protein